MKKRDLVAVIFLAVIICFAVGVKIWNRMNVPDDTFERQYRGLGGRADIGEYEGMYFIFSFQGKLRVVMREMRFPIDVIWLRGDTVVDIRKDLKPEPDRKESNLTSYENTSPADSFLELKAGGSDRLDIKVGDRLVFCKDAGKCAN